MNLEIKRVFEDENEMKELFEYLNKKEIEYHKVYKRFGKPAKVPRGQASYTLDETIHYNYGVSGGSPINEIMDDTLKYITSRVNAVLNSNFNTILMNVYRLGSDKIGYHRDKEKGWVEGTGFATLSLGAERDFLIRKEHEDEGGTVTTIRTTHKNGTVLHLPWPMNRDYTHSVPAQMKVKGTRISLTFREIVPTVPLPSN